MRFRTMISNVALFHNIIKSLSALAKICVIRLSPEKVHFIVAGNEGREGVQVWSQVKVPTLFTSFRIESNSNNEIWLQINLESLLRVLKSADSSAPSALDSRSNNARGSGLAESEVSLKLNKRQGDSVPIWAFEIRGKSANDREMVIAHEIRVHVLTQRRQQELNEPLCPAPDIHLVLPNLGDLRNIVSRLGHMSDDVKVSANHEGKMELTVKSNLVDLTTTWSGLHNPNSTADGEDEEPPPPREQMFSTNVSIRAVQKFLTSHLVGGTAIACICERHCVIAYVYIGEINDAGGVLTFFIPAKNVDEDD